ncbi:MAG: hypothetical protein NTV86_05135 [Planctomycetota bacterium]|nr:hypothetical protein [Planctomycetota bacterium]
MESKDLWVELKPGRPSYMVLRGTYGEKVHNAFRMSRQGVRWRFQHLFGHIYVSAFETILAIESSFGAQLREHAIRISKERHAIRQEIDDLGFQGADSFLRTDDAGNPAEGDPVSDEVSDPK